MDLNRRMFLASLAPLAAAAPARKTEGTPWHRNLRRVAHFNFNERDPLDLNVDAWADCCASFKPDAVALSVTGILAFYPSDVPFHRRAKTLNNRDLFGECCRAARGRGMRVIARMSPEQQSMEAFATHPEWFIRDAKGKTVGGGDGEGRALTCTFSTYFTGHVPAIMREVNERYQPDAIYTNGWPDRSRLPECYCDTCRKLAKPGAAGYRRQYMERMAFIWKLWDSIAKEKKPDGIYMGSLGGESHPALDLLELAKYCEWFACERQGRDIADALWDVSEQGRVAQSVMKGRTITYPVGAWTSGRLKWRHVSKSPAELEMTMASTVASGMRVWYHWPGAREGLVEDRRWQETGRKFCQWQARHDEHFSNKRSVADVGVVFSQRTLYNSRTQADFKADLSGFYNALLDGRHLWDYVHEDDLGPATVKKYRALILPNVALLSDRQCAQLRDYAGAGGGLLATFETGLYDQDGKPRPEFALAELFGIRKAGGVRGSKEGNLPNSRIERPHPIVAGFRDTRWIAGAEHWVPVKTQEPSFLTVIPSYRSHPPEVSYPTVDRTDFAAAVAVERGASRLVYLSGDVERTAWKSGNSDLMDLLGNSIRWILNGKSTVTVEGEGFVEVFGWETEPGWAVHILNYNNPNLHRGWVRRHSPIGPQKVRVTLPAGERAARAKLLRAETDLRIIQKGGTIEFEIPRVVDYEVAALYRA